MKDLVTDIKALQEETLKNLQNSKATNTVRAYKSDFKDFDAFCAKLRVLSPNASTSFLSTLP